MKTTIQDSQTVTPGRGKETLTPSPGRLAVSRAVENERGISHCLVAIDNQHEVVAMVNQCSTLEEGNAQRLALAWNCHDEMLKLLRRLERTETARLGEMQSEGETPPNLADCFDNVILIRSVLAKATGGAR